MNDETRLRVLVVDDVFDIRLLIRTRLAEDPKISVVGEAADPDEALRLADALQPQVVVTDLFASTGRTGFLTRMRELLPQACIVLCSASSRSDEVVVSALAEGADGYLDKGEGFSGLGDRLLDLCQRRRSPS